MVFKIHIQKVVTNGPYAYILYQDGVAQKDAEGLASIGAALDAVKADIASLLGAAVVQSADMTVIAQ